jgi:ABC-type hemin transport system substrate-binding protein
LAAGSVSGDAKKTGSLSLSLSSRIYRYKNKTKNKKQKKKGEIFLAASHNGGS